MALSYEQLIAQVTKDQALQLLIDLLDSYDFPAKSWESGSIQRTMFEATAELYARARAVGAVLAMGGHNAFARGDWLTMFSDSQYDNQRLSGRKTQGMETIVDAANVGPFTIEVGTVVVSDTANNYRYRNVTSGVLPQGGTLSLKFEADVVGAAQNVGNDELTVMVLGPSGATVTNPAGGGGTWITQSGADEESDPALQARNTSKWGTLALAGGPSAAYEYWARVADTAVRRVFVDPSSVDGTGALAVYIAGDDGALAPSVVQTVADYINGTDGVGRRPNGVNLTVASATEDPIAITLTAYLQPGLLYDDPTRAAVQAAVGEFFTLLPIGGTRVDLTGPGKLLLGRLYHALFAVTGVANVTLSLTADVVLDPHVVAVPNVDYLFEGAF